MADVVLKKRVNRLEDLMAQLIRTVDRVDKQLDRTDEQIARTERQMEKTQCNLDQFSDEMREFKQETRHEIRDMRKQWGELSNKMGTMAEDLVAPSIGRILRETVGCSENGIEYMAVRVKKRHPVTKRNQEYDVVAVSGEYMLINETKSQLKPEDVEKFVTKLSEAREFFPEYAEKKIIGAIASLYVDDSIVRFGERSGLIVLGFGEDVMDVLNQPGFVPKEF